MIITDTAVRQRVSVVVLSLLIFVVSVVVLSLLIFVFGLYSYSTLPRESEPDITIPFVFVSTEYKGVSSSDIETSITIPIEKKLKGLEGVKQMRSLSSEGLSSISMEFVTGTDIDNALEKVRNKVDEAKNDLPRDLENDPSVFEVNFSELPIVVYSLSGPCGNPCLKRLADDLEDDIEAIPGVLDVEVAGGLEREIRVEVLPDKLAYYGIPITAFQRVVESENINTSGGAIRLGDGRYQLRVPGEFDTPDEILGLVVGTRDGGPVYLKDMARVVDGFKDETSRARLDGVEAVSISIKKRAGENIIAITDQVEEIIERRSPSWPQGTRITKLMDKAKDIRLMVADLENNILSGLVLVVVVLLFSLGLRNAVLVSLAIPLSMLLSFTVLGMLGVTLNMVVLYSLTLALGMLVDNAIVIVENIYRHMQQGVPRIQAAMQAASDGRHRHHACGLRPHAFLAGHHGGVHEVPAHHPHRHAELEPVRGPRGEPGPGLHAHEAQGARPEGGRKPRRSDGRGRKAGGDKRPRARAVHKNIAGSPPAPRGGAHRLLRRARPPYRGMDALRGARKARGVFPGHRAQVHVREPGHPGGSGHRLRGQGHQAARDASLRRA